MKYIVTAGHACDTHENRYACRKFPALRKAAVRHSREAEGSVFEAVEQMKQFLKDS